MMNDYQANKPMISQREVIRKYQKMIELEGHKGKADPNKLNCYRCSDDHCGHITKTIDRDRGTTPFMFRCERCGEMAQSTFYNDIAPHIKPTIEWYRPTLEEALKYRSNETRLEFILKGGLECRVINESKNVAR